MKHWELNLVVRDHIGVLERVLNVFTNRALNIQRVEARGADEDDPEDINGIIKIYLEANSDSLEFLPAVLGSTPGIVSVDLIEIKIQ